MSDIRATLRQKFEAAFPVPKDTAWLPKDSCYMTAAGGRFETTHGYNTLWRGFKACHPIADADAVRDCGEKCIGIGEKLDTWAEKGVALACLAEIKSLAP